MPYADRQLPREDEVFLDHVGFFLADLEGAGARLERLGFQVSPVQTQTNAGPDGVQRPSGTSNRLVRFRRGFLEFLGATHDGPLADQLNQAVARYEGLHLIALSHDDIPGQGARLEAAGFAILPMVEMRRPLPTPDGPRENGWRVQRVKPGEMIEGRVQFVRCLTPDVSWQAQDLVHDNGADALTDMLVCVEERRSVAARYGRFAGREPVHEAARSVLALDRGNLIFVEPAEITSVVPAIAPPAPPFMAGQAVAADIAKVAAALRRGGVEPVVNDGRLICVGAADGLGACLLFHDSTVHDPWAALAELCG